MRLEIEQSILVLYLRPIQPILLSHRSLIFGFGTRPGDHATDIFPMYRVSVSQGV